MDVGPPPPRDWIGDADLRDAAWTAAVRALPEAERLALLARADRLAQAGDGDRAADVYEALEADLDPLVPEGASRIRRLVSTRRAGSARLEALFARTAQASCDRALSTEAAAIVAQRAAARGDRGAAERAYLDLFARVRGRGGRAEAIACVNYAKFCLASGREFEALVAARRAEALFRELDDPWGLSLALLHVLRVAEELRDWVRVEASLPEVEALLSRLPAREATLVRISLHDRRAHAAWARGLADEALAHVDAAQALVAASFPAPSPFADPRAGALLRVRALVAGRRHGEAVAEAERALAHGEPHETLSMLLRVARLEALAASGAPDVEAEATALLDACRDHAADLSPGRRREVAGAVAHVLAGIPPALRTMRRAFDVAAGAALERAGEVDRFVRSMPEASELRPEDAETLEDHRRSTLAEQAALGAAVARALERAAEDGLSALPMFGDADGLTCVCAWCQRVRTKDGVWLSVQQFLPLRSAGPVQLTHGICARCASALYASSDPAGR